MECAEILARLRALANPDSVAGMARYGINPHNTLGVSIPALRKLARQVGQQATRSARWIASDALRELESAAVQERLPR